MTRWERNLTVGLAADAASPTGDRDLQWEETGALGGRVFALGSMANICVLSRKFQTQIAAIIHWTVPWHRLDCLR